MEVVRAKRAPKFAERFKEACDNCTYCPPLHQGRQTWLVSQLARRKIFVSKESVRKWLEGEVRPKQDKCEVLAEILGVNATWLYMGQNTSPDENQPLIEISVNPPIRIAVRNDIIVEVSGVPFDLKGSEARRIANIILAHALEG